MTAAPGNRESELRSLARTPIIDKQASAKLMPKTHFILDGCRGGFTNHRVVMCDTNTPSKPDAYAADKFFAFTLEFFQRSAAKIPRFPISQRARHFPIDMIALSGITCYYRIGRVTSGRPSNLIPRSGRNEQVRKLEVCPVWPCNPTTLAQTQTLRHSRAPRRLTHSDSTLSALPLHRGNFTFVAATRQSIGTPNKLLAVKNRMKKEP